MTAPQGSWKRVLLGLVSAIIAAPVATAICFELRLLLEPGPPKTLLDEIGGGIAFLIIALLFGGFLAAFPVLIFGTLAVALAHGLGTRSSAYYVTAGLLGGVVMAWLDIVVRKDVFTVAEAIPFVVGGCSSALAYWAVAERGPSQVVRRARSWQ